MKKEKWGLLAQIILNLDSDVVKQLGCWDLAYRFCLTNRIVSQSKHKLHNKYSNFHIFLRKYIEYRVGFFRVLYGLFSMVKIREKRQSLVDPVCKSL